MLKSNISDKKFKNAIGQYKEVVIILMKDLEMN